MLQKVSRKTYFICSSFSSTSAVTSPIIPGGRKWPDESTQLICFSSMSSNFTADLPWACSLSWGWRRSTETYRHHRIYPSKIAVARLPRDDFRTSHHRLRPRRFSVFILLCRHGNTTAINWVAHRLLSLLLLLQNIDVVCHGRAPCI